MATQQATSIAGRDQGLSLLSIDGGGVRGLSALYVLDQLMESINEKAQNEPPLKPCEYFDMIGGASTGGIIAIMLGRLRMGVQECISTYIRLADKVFTKAHHRVNWKGNVQGRFDHEALESVIKEIIILAGYAEGALLKDDSPKPCKVFVCAVSERSNTLTTFTSYKAPQTDRELLNQATILQACRATSAASSFFDPLTMNIGQPGANYEDSFIDGALGYNNPIRQLWTEAGFVWGGPLDDKIACVVSIGTGKPSLGDFGPGVIDMGKRLLAISTETEVTAGQFYYDQRYSLVKDKRYYRFNVEKGLENVGLEEAKEKSRIIKATKEYLKDGETFDKMEQCAEQLATREWLCGLIKSTLFLAQLASDQFERSQPGKQPEVRDSLKWFTNTKLYHAWLSPRREGVISSRFIWNATKENPEFGTIFSAARRKEGVHVLYFNCRQDTGKWSNFQRIALRYPQIGSSKTALILWSLIGQALQGGYNSTDDMRACISEITKTYPCIFFDIQKDIETTFDALEKLLQAALGLVPKEKTMIVLDHVEVLDQKVLKPLRASIQRVLDCQSSDDVAQVRCLISGKPTHDVRIAFQGTASIDEDTQYFEFLQSLKFDSMDRRRDRIVAPEVNTTHWIWSNPSYLGWHQTSSGILWIQGKPGSGKSVLAKSIQKRLMELADSSSISISARPIVGAWYYSAREKLQDHSMMLRSLLLQVLEQDRSLFTYVERFIHIEESGRSWYHGNLSEMIKMILLEISTSYEENRKICCVVDGFDESHIRQLDGGLRDTLLFFFKRLVKPPSRFKLICLSRPIHDIEKSLRHCHSIILQQVNLSDVKQIVDAGLKIVVQALSEDDSSTGGDSSSNGGSDEDDENPSAIRTRPVARLADKRGLRKSTKILKRLKGYFRKVKIEENDRLENIRSYLIEHASGVILWITTILKALETRAREPLCDLEEIEKELYRLPVDLAKLYRNIVIGLVDTLGKDTLETSRRALVWVSVATAVRPFQLQELLDALALDRKLKVHSWNSFHRQLQRLCGPFIEVIRPADSTHGDVSSSDLRGDDEVQLLHQTVKDFLEDKEAAGPLYVYHIEAQRTVRAESIRYIETALPSLPSDHSPLPVQPGSDWKQNVRAIAVYLEERPLLPLILNIDKELQEKVPEIYRFIFENTTNPSLMDMTEQQKTELGNLEYEFASPYARKGQSAVVEEYFRTACVNGWVTAIENILLLSSLRYSKEQMWEWYYDEPAIIHGTLMVAIGQNMLKEVKSLAFYVYVRGLDLLYRDDQELRQTALTCEALQSSNEELALVVFGYANEKEEQRLLEYIRDQHRAMPPKVASENADKLLEIRKSIHAVLEFWSPPRGKRHGPSEQIENEGAIRAGAFRANVVAKYFSLSYYHLCEALDNGSLDNLHIYKPRIQPLHTDRLHQQRLSALYDENKASGYQRANSK